MTNASHNPSSPDDHDSLAPAAATVPFEGLLAWPAVGTLPVGGSRAKSEANIEYTCCLLAEACRPAWRPRRRIRRAPDRVGSLADARLASGRAIVGPEGNRSPWYLAVKRALDIVGALGLLVALSPVLVATYLVLLVTTRGKPIFRQERLGYRGLPFTMYKFRTMRTDAIERQREVKNEQEGPIFKNRRDPRVTRVGRLLRSTSIDEMPQLINVLLGQMSLVGPRPPLAEEVARYAPWQRRRLAVKPGLTCLWQVSGRSEIGFEQWVRMDLWYVKNQSFLTDVRLLARTPASVLSRRGAY